MRTFQRTVLALVVAAPLWTRAQTPKVSAFESTALPEVVTSVAFTPNNQYLLLGTEKGVVARSTMTHLRDVSRLFVLGGDKPVVSLAVSNDNKYVAALNALGRLVLWEAATSSSAELSFELSSSNAKPQVVFSPDNKYFAVSSKLKVVIMETRSRAIVKERPAGFVTGLAFSPNSQQLLMGQSINATVTVWAFGPDSSYTLGGAAGSWTAKAGSVLSADYSPDGRYIVATYKGGGVALYDAQSRKELAASQLKDDITLVRFTLDGQYLVTSNETGKVKVWTLPDLKLKLSLHEYESALTSFALSADGKHFVGTDGKAPSLYDLSWLQLGKWKPADTEGPAIALLSPRAGSQTLNDGALYAGSPQRRIKVSARINDLSGVQRVEINGKLAQPTEPGGNRYESEGLMALEENTYVPLEIRAVDSVGNVTQQRYGVEYKPVQLVGAENYHALFIAVSDYQDEKIPSLDQPVADAERLANVLVDRYTFKRENVEVIKNPTRAELVQRFEDLAARVQSTDNLLVFYAGHGVWDETMGQGFWLPADAEDGNRANWFPNNQLKDYIASIQSKHTLLITDACFSGGIFKTRAFGEDASPAIEEMYKLKSRKAMTSGALKPVPDKSVFLAQLIQHLEQNPDDYLTAAELFNGFRTEVINSSPTHQVPLYGEIGSTGDQGGEFVFIRRKE
ncbi:MAG: caspase family protein [Bacteroidia bacterium]|nr:caspase family protein [Bacteroidia bacterium]